jgi:hypothetical protein
MDIFTQGQGYQAYNFGGERCQEKKSSRAIIRLQQGSEIDDKVNFAHCPNSTSSLDASQPPVAMYNPGFIVSIGRNNTSFLNMLMQYDNRLPCLTPVTSTCHYMYIGRFHLPVLTSSKLVCPTISVCSGASCVP